MLRQLKDWIVGYFTIFPSKHPRRDRLLQIISPHIREWTRYQELVDIVKKEAPEMYKFGEGAGRYMSGEFQVDLSTLCLEGNVREQTNFKKSPHDLCYRAYRLENSSTRLIRRIRLRHIGKIQPSKTEQVDLSNLSDL